MKNTDKMNLDNLKGQRIDGEQIKGGQKPASQEFVLGKDQRPLDKASGENQPAAAASKRNTFKNRKK